jgi:hypothetical protein
MFAKQPWVYCVLITLLGSKANAQEYVSQKVSYEVGTEHQQLMVGVGSEAQWSLVSRLTSSIGQTVSLESIQHGVYFDDTSDAAYERLNERALTLRSASVIFVAAHPHCSVAKLWYERLANHGVRVIELRPVSGVHGQRASESLTRQIYLGLIFATADRQAIDANFCNTVNDIKANHSASSKPVESLSK